MVKNNMKKKKYFSRIFFVLISSCLFLSACSTSTVDGKTQEEQQVQDVIDERESSLETDDVNRPQGWTEETHGKSVDADYDMVFPQDAVNRIDITISSENWQAMMDNMTELYGEQGDGTRVGTNPGEQGDRGGMNRPGQGWQPGEGEFPQDRLPPGEGAQPPGFPPGRPEGGMPGEGMPGGGGILSAPDPDYVTTTVSFNGLEWSNVGMRFRGNSTIRTSWSNGNLKISFMLDFDEFEDQYPQIDDQRFYGFKKLVFHSNAFDSSYLREKVTADIFRDAGLVSAQTAFYEVYIDYGEGPVYFGLYTALEMVDDTVIETQFEDDDGNVYKPEGDGASFAAGTFNQESFEKSTNQEEADWSDIEAVFAALHAETRLSDLEQWRVDLESVFDVDVFLNWLAVDTLVQNWDTYGVMSHNYYLYTDPDTDLVTWIPWDNNMALSGSGGRQDAKTFDQSTVTEDWPLIRYLMDDSVYYQKYLDYLSSVMETVFIPERLAEIFQANHDLITPYVAAETSPYTQLGSLEQFEQSVQSLIDHVTARYQEGQEFLTQ